LSGYGREDKGWALVDGQPGERISLRDRGLHYGDGLFETVRRQGGRLCWFDRHLARLARGCERLGIAMPDPAVLRAEAGTIAPHLGQALIKIIVTRGAATARGYRPAGDERTTRLVCAYDWPAVPPAEFRAGVSAVRLGINPALAGLKHLNRLEQVLAQRDAAQQGLHEVLMASSAGGLVCGSMSNLFAWRGAWLQTPPVDECGVAGVMRSLVLEAAAALGIEVRVAPLPPAELADCRAMFVTNVRLGLQPIHWHQGRRLESDERTAALQGWIDATAR
jgi:4-amino-4-deoxychorismate lyase